MAEILSRDALVRRVAADRAAGRTVVLASGSFDLLHVGHTRQLAAAAREADVLVVAIQDDASVRAVEGGRPVVAAGDRARLVAALRWVDYVVVFPELTAGPLLELVRPDVYCSGSHAMGDGVPEHAIVTGYGGRIAVVGDPADHSSHSSQALLARIAAPRT